MLKQLGQQAKQFSKAGDSTIDETLLPENGLALPKTDAKRIAAIPETPLGAVELVTQPNI